jgi:hypothetical protein
MNTKTIRGLVVLAVALWAFRAFTADSPIPETYPAIVAADCGPEPSWTNRDAWYAYGDCSGDYGPIDAAE